MIGPQLVIVKLGVEGVFVNPRNEEGYLVPGSVIDTVGAGDGFTTGVLTALAEGATVQDSVRRGMQLALYRYNLPVTTMVI